MKIKLTITNTNKKAVVIKVLNCMYELPKGVSAKVDSTVSYEALCEHFRHNPEMIRFMRSTNNRQLMFYIQDIHGFLSQPEPSLTITGKERKKVWYSTEYGDDWEYKPKWNPKKWNIADTHERIIWDTKNISELKIGAYQKFEIEFKIVKIK